MGSKKSKNSFEINKNDRSPDYFFWKNLKKNYLYQSS